MQPVTSMGQQGDLLEHIEDSVSFDRDVGVERLFLAFQP